MQNFRLAEYYAEGRTAWRWHYRASRRERTISEVRVMKAGHEYVYLASSAGVRYCRADPGMPGLPSMLCGDDPVFGRTYLFASRGEAEEFDRAKQIYAALKQKIDVSRAEDFSPEQILSAAAALGICPDRT